MQTMGWELTLPSDIPYSLGMFPLRHIVFSRLHHHREAELIPLFV